MTTGARVTALIPARNEAASITQVVEALRGIDLVDQIIVVDDASSDDTGDLARRAGATVIRHAASAGKGQALNTGLAAAQGDIILAIDGDTGESAAEAVKLVQPLVAGVADLTIAAFPRAKRKGGFGLVKGLARWAIRTMAGLEAQSPLSGQRAMRREVIDALGGFAQGYGVEVGMTIDAVRRGFRVLEVPVAMTHHETGRDLAGFIHRGRQFYHVLREVAKRLVSR